MERIRGLDSIRFICAFIVVLGHFGVLVVSSDKDSMELYQRALYALLVNAFNGPAAVIVFFVISGFCIHYPHLGKRRVADVKAFYLRRFIRLLIPTVVAVILSLAVDVDLSYPLFGVFWSVVCEAVYYFLYPALLWIRNKSSWGYMVLGSYLLAILGLLFNFDALRSSGDYGVLGLGTWILGLPCWLLGCWLAENFGKFRVLDFKQIMMVRCFVFFISVALRVFKFHGPAVISGDSVTLTCFAPIVVFWLGLEIAYFRVHKPMGVLENFGAWSFSLYIVHIAVPGIFALFGFSGVFFGLKFPMIAFALAFAYLFFLVVERPSHFLAKRLGARKVVI